MLTAFLCFVFMLLVMAAMSIGVIMGRKPISGSCGGIAALDLGDCEICGGDPAKCDTELENTERKESDEQFYDVSAK